MDELEELKKKKLAEIQQASQNQQEEQQQIEQLESVIKQIFTKEALERYGNIKAAHPEKAVQVLVVSGQLIQERKIQKIDDNTLKEILKQLTPEQKDFKIKRV